MLYPCVPPPRGAVAPAGVTACRQLGRFAESLPCGSVELAVGVRRLYQPRPTIYTEVGGRCVGVSTTAGFPL
eukprot:gene2787-biopygen3164